MADFICKNKECEFYEVKDYYSEYSVVMRGGKMCFLDKNNKRIMCRDCGEVLERIEVKNDGFCTNIALFNSKSPQEKRAILKKRADKVFQTNKEMRDYKDAAENREL